MGEGSPYQALQEATVKNILSNIQSQEMATSKNIQQADFFNQRDAVLEALKGMSQDERQKYYDMPYDQIIKELNP